MNNWVKMTNDEMEVGIEIATLKKGELQIKYAKDIVAKNKEIERLNMVIKAIRNYCLINELYSTNETIKEIINQKANSEWLKRLAS